MGTKAWDDYLKSVQIQIGHLGTTAEIRRVSIGRLVGRAKVDTRAAGKARRDLKEPQELLEETIDVINELQELYEHRRRSSVGLASV